MTVTTVDLERHFADHHARLVRVAALLTGDPDAAEDVVAEVFARLVRRPGRLGVEQPGAYLRRCVVNEVTSQGRRATRRARIRGRNRLRVVDAAAPDGAVVERDRVLRALGRLPARQRAAVVLRFYEDLPEAQVAEVLGVPVGTVKSATSRGAARLRELLDEEQR